MDGRQEQKQQLQNELWPLPAPREPSPRRVLAGLGGGQRAPGRGDSSYTSPAQRDPTDGPAPRSCPTPVTIASLIYALNGTGRRLSL